MGRALEIRKGSRDAFELPGSISPTAQDTVLRLYNSLCIADAYSNPAKTILDTYSRGSAPVFHGAPLF